MIELPHAFETYTRQLMGDEEYSALCLALAQEPAVSLRLNPYKQHGRAPLGTPVPWCNTGHYVDERPSFTFDPLFHAGAYYVQEASSMFLEQIVRQHVVCPVCWLDLCAAPGGKSTHALSVVPPGSFVVANEPVRARAQVLAENVTKWGVENAMVTSAFPDEWSRIPPLFDVVLTDVPCSGEGMFRKDPQAVAEWSTDNVSRCVERQRQIVLRAWELLKPGGLLIYSTCTFNTREDEEMIAWAVDTLGAEFLPVETNNEWKIADEMGGFRLGYRFLPHHTRGEGLFMSALRKPGCPSDLLLPAPKTGKQKRGVAKSELPFTHSDWVTSPDDLDFVASPDRVVALPRLWRGVYELLSSHLAVLHAGITVAVPKGREWVPHHALALSTRLNIEKFRSIDLLWNEAIAYLRCEALRFDTPHDKGISLVTYKNLPLGWINCVGNRANNLYPSEWRIRSSYLPPKESIIHNEAKCDHTGHRPA